MSNSNPREFHISTGTEKLTVAYTSNISRGMCELTIPENFVLKSKFYTITVIEGKAKAPTEITAVSRLLTCFSKIFFAEILTNKKQTFVSEGDNGITSAKITVYIESNKNEKE